MDINLFLRTNSLVVIYAPQAGREESSVITARLALRGEVTVLDGGNLFQAYRVAHLIRRWTPDVRAVADRLFIQRAFTCYQMLALLESTPARPQPHLILDLLVTFYDDHVPTREASRLLEACLNSTRASAPHSAGGYHPGSTTTRRTCISG